MEQEAEMQRVTVQQSPYNAETPAAAWEVAPTPTGLFYVRNHFPTPRLDAATWRLRVSGAVQRSLELSLDELRALPSHSVTMTMECAGNGRTMLDPPPEGVRWGLGAVSTARFTGVPLRLLLERAGVAPEAVDVAFVGADQGEVEPGREEPFARSLPVAHALDPDVLVAWAINDEPLPAENGWPARLVVPRMYGMASVKWLTSIEVLERPFDGYYQLHYAYVDEPGTPNEAPVGWMRVRSLIARPAPGALLLEPVQIAGTAWSGAAPVERVEVSVDGGATWMTAWIEPGETPYVASRWRLRWVPPHAGHFVLMARATDAAGNVQPLDPVHNRRGYGNNAVHRVEVRVG